MLIRNVSTVLLTAALALSVTACATNSSSHSKGPAEEKAQQAGRFLDDTAISMKIKSALAQDKAVSALAVNIDTKDGYVTLKGDVPNEEAARAAIRHASQTEGVRGVKSELVIKP